MQRIEVNVVTGEQKVIDLTPEEVADAQSRTLAEANDPQRAQQQLNAALLSPATIQFLLDQVPQEAKDSGPAEVRQIAVLQAQREVATPAELEKLN